MGAVFGPRRAVPFLNRVGAREEMRRLLVTRRAEERACLLFVHGPEGMGRASLASEFFHEDPSAFDSYIEVVARQPDGRLVQQGEMLGQALRGLGLADTDQAGSDAARSDAFQRLSTGKRFLMVVKDVASAEQVTRLIPAAAPDAAVVVTTRTMLRELLHHDFADIPLGKLPQAESRQLLAMCLDGTADKIAVKTLHELADLCDGFPLLIRILAAQLARRPRTAARFVGDLRTSATALLSMDYSQRMTRFLDLAYEFLVRDLQVAYRRLALLPGPSFSAGAAAIALDTEVTNVERLLDDLVDTNLLVFDEESDRYSFYRIVRADARRRARLVDGAETCRSAISRVTAWYLDQAVPRDAALAKRWRVGPVFERHAVTRAQPVGRADAARWFDAEWPSLADCVGMAHEEGLHDIAWQTCVVLFKYLHLHGHYDSWLDTHRLGVLSAEASGDIAGIMQVTSQRGAAHLAVGDRESARADFVVSLEAAARIGHVLGEQSAQEWLGKVAAEAGDVDSAVAYYDESEAVIRHAREAIDAEQQERMRALLSLHRARLSLFRNAWEKAAVTAADALRYFESGDESDNEAKCLLVLGKAAYALGETAEAVRRFEGAADLFGRDNARRAQADALRWLGDALVAAGRAHEAALAYRRAQEIFVSLGDSAADLVADRLGALTRS